jgi:acetyltransferase-like isoleucine patch superfamily enzyme
LTARLETRGRLASVPLGGALDRLWRKANRRLAVRGQVVIGTAPRIGAGTAIWSAHGLKIGDYCAVGPRSFIQVDGRIGDFLMTGPGVLIVGRADHAIREIGRPMLLSTWIGERDQTDEDIVHIGDDVWLGAAAVVLGGVTIGTGAVVGAGAVITHDVADFAIVAGNPARVVGERLPPAVRAEHVRALCELKDSLGHAS